jgi:hypothetical protein
VPVGKHLPAGRQDGECLPQSNRRKRRRHRPRRPHGAGGKTPPDPDWIQGAVGCRAGGAFPVSAVTIAPPGGARCGRRHPANSRWRNAARDSDDAIDAADTTARKSGIATAATELIRDTTVILDSGTTTAEIARQVRGLRLESINVITNALNVAVLLANAPHVNLIMPGGVLRGKSWSLCGPQAENAMRDLQADLLFLGVDSLDPEIGLMTPHVLEAQLNAQMIRIARTVVAVTDSSKLLRRNLSVIAPVARLTS